MSRAPLMIALAAWTLALGASASPRNPHLDPSIVTGGCASCHQGHGVARSPMLPGAQKQLCLSCHGSMAETARRVAAGVLAPNVRPPLLGGIAAKPYAHPISAEATSASGPNVVTCTSCHSPHRGGRDERLDRGETKRSPRDPLQSEFELCQSCHGQEGNERTGIARKLDPNNRSFHPIEAPSPERAESVEPAASGRRIACTDCHGNDDRQGPRGPHASNVPFILKSGYRQSDGPESLQAFALCYGCHDRKKVLEAEPHARHVQLLGVACAACHDAHGSIAHRALVDIGEDDGPRQVLPSLRAGRLSFVSERRGAGECYLTCHGVDHAPKSYGVQSVMTNVPAVDGLPPASLVPLPPDRRAVQRPGDPTVVRERRSRERP